jgi:hypothetical protein
MRSEEMELLDKREGMELLDELVQAAGLINLFDRIQPFAFPVFRKHWVCTRPRQQNFEPDLAVTMVGRGKWRCFVGEMLQLQIVSARKTLRLHNRCLSERLCSFLRRFTGAVCVVGAFEALRGHFCKHRTRSFSRLIGS